MTVLLFIVKNYLLFFIQYSIVLSLYYVLYYCSNVYRGGMAQWSTVLEDSGAAVLGWVLGWCLVSGTVKLYRTSVHKHNRIIYLYETDVCH